ncbi:hypothetical protein IF1G_07295 [Cordyceps javanica]|uniref:Uncharacterized protein n=1 Tax=Cordyceps javanica TaxID=43265 RepID=A0A545UY91_9HYPO|nr:hypothetical protein IF1G_07295 [Cordyceps javanica]
MSAESRLYAVHQARASRIGITCTKRVLWSQPYACNIFLSFHLYRDPSTTSHFHVALIMTYRSTGARRNCDSRAPRRNVSHFRTCSIF